MRFMVLIKADKNSEAGVMPDEKLFADMGKFNEELVQAGVMLAGEGLQPSSKGARVRFVGDQRVVTDGPFAETKELIAGFWLWKAKSLQEAIDWVKRCPNPMPGTEAEIEIRQVFEMEDFGPEFTPELRAQEEKLRTQIAGQVLPECGPGQAKPLPEHRWLQQLVGDWTSEMEATMGPDQPPMTSKGSESVRLLGELWSLGEGKGEMPDGTVGTTLMTLGYDPVKKCFVGTFIGSMMTHLWVYTRGSLDTAGKKLTLEAEGPNMTAPGKMALYRDAIEFLAPDHRVLTSQVLGDDGQWRQFMTAHYRRQ